jgi:hypothetical protein
LREKSFVRPIDPAELARLRQSIRTIRCASCGAPVDIEQSTVCPYCQAPIVALDPGAVDKALRELDAAEQKRIAPDPDKVGDAIVALARLQSEMERERQRERLDEGIDLVGLGLSALGKVLRW